MNNSEPLNSPEAIAIVGMAGRFPGARNLDEFWRNLCDSVESITFFSDEELAEAGIQPELLKNPNYVKAAGVLEGADLFDASFFGFSPKEAEIMDPQQRLFLETAWEALENAGYDAECFNGLIGVYAGLSASTYLYNIVSRTDLIGSVSRLMIILGNDKDHLPLRASYKMNLKGPSINVNTACSTSLVAVHLACQSLLIGECDAALAGGITITVPQKSGYLYEKEGLLSPDGHCRAFDASASGTVCGNGVGVVVLRRLSDALADGDYIHAVIKGSAVNNDGAMKVGYTAPGVEGQANVIAEALALARVAPETIQYIETHGSGTALGDAIELSALNEVFRAHTSASSFCAIGSVKTNLGHLDSAAGVAGLIKAVLSLKHKKIPASLNFEQPNPKLAIDDSPFYVNTALRHWPANGHPRRAGVSSFGLGGTNVHVILEEKPQPEPSSPARPWNLIVLSAKTESALEAATDALSEHLQKNAGQNLADIAYTHQTGRRCFEHRRIAVSPDQDHLLRTLANRDPKSLFSGSSRACSGALTFMFPGLGDHYVNMGAELYRHESVFRKQVDYCSQLVKTYLGLDLLAALYPPGSNGTATGGAHSAKATPEATIDLRRMLRRDDGAKAVGATGLDQTILAQPALFTIEYALASLLMSWGIRPESMIGYSIGEYVAACLAGVVSLEDALYMVAKRAEIIQRLPGGEMLAVLLSEQKLLPLLRDGVSISAVNTPSFTIVSGPQERVRELADRLTEQGTICRSVQTTHAFHSRMMDAGYEPFIKEVKRIPLRSPKIPYISNVTGTWVTESEATDPTYWARHMCAPVRFGEGITPLLENRERIFLEVGPGHSLGSILLQHPSSKQSEDMLVLASLRHKYEKQSDEALLLYTLGRLWLAGAEPDWAAFYADQRRCRVPLPTYPFERQRYWIEPNRAGQAAGASRPPSNLNIDMADWFSVPIWKPSASPASAATRDAQAMTGNWLIFISDAPFAAELLQKCETLAQSVITVRVAEAFACLDSRSYALNPDRREDYDRLLEALLDTDCKPDHIVHLWGVADDSELPGRQRFQPSQALGVYSLLFLTQSLAQYDLAQSIAGTSADLLTIDVLTDGMQPVTGFERLYPEKATVLGPCKTISQEYPNLVCRSIDLVVPLRGSWQERELLARLAAELSAPPEELVVAYRGTNRWVQAYQPLRVEGADREPKRLREKGVYWITGGLGRDSLVRAKYLAEKFQARLILTGRSELPPRTEWEDWLKSHDAEDKTSEKIRQLLELEAAGAEVLVLRADVASPQQMQAVVQAIEERFGELHGVIHAAGLTDVTDSRLITEADRVDCEKHFQSKVYGCYVLEEVLKDKPLDFCILTSSVASITGGVGILAYTSASIFMDAFAHRHNQTEAACWTSLNWQGVSPEETVEAFRRVLSLEPQAQVIVSPEDLQASIERRIHLDFLRQPNLGQTKAHARPRLRTTYLAPRNDVEQRLAELWQLLLGIDQVGVHDNFLELGGDSLLGVQLIARLRKIFNIQLGVRSLFESPTIAELALTIEEMLIEEIARLSEEETSRLH